MPHPCVSLCHPPYLSRRISRSYVAAALAALGTLGALGLPERALACGGLGYQQELQTNADGSVVAGSLGLNLLVVGSIDGLSAKFYRLSEGEPEEIGVEIGSESLAGYIVRLSLAQAIEAGVEYRLVVEDTSEGQAGSKEYTFLGVEAPARPETIALSVSASELGRAVAGGCGELYLPGKQAMLQLEEADALTAWERGVRHQLLLDGEPAFRDEVPLIDSLGEPQAPVVRAVVDCSDPDLEEDSELLSAAGILLTWNLEPKQYRAQWQLTFPDGTQLLSDEQPLDLRCQVDDEEPEPPQNGDGDNDSGADEPAGSTAGSGACSVSPGQASSVGSLWALALAACAFMLGRRKAR